MNIFGGRNERTGAYLRKAEQLMGEAIRRKQDEPKLKILELMKTEMEMAGSTCEPDWNKVIKQCRKIWEGGEWTTDSIRIS